MPKEDEIQNLKREFAEFKESANQKEASTKEAVAILQKENGELKE